MRRLYLTYTDPAILRQAVAEFGRPKAPTTQRHVAGSSSSLPARVKTAELLRHYVADVPWGHHLVILNKVETPAARLYYLRATTQLGWSRNVLLNQIKARAYERSLTEGKTHNFPAALPTYLAEQAEEVLKSSYNLEFLGIGRAVQERELEHRLLERVRDFILELGYGFCFIGNQYRLTLGRKEYFIDLLFYHRFLKALVAIELKVGPFAPEFAGKMDFYLNLLNATEKAPDDNPSIGIILCAEKDALEVEFSLKTRVNPIGVAEYQLVPKLPKELQGKLPSARELRELLQNEITSPIQD
jgi:predicted nuclease of restriction endonuclease-like (RecB) superfamily